MVDCAGGWVCGALYALDRNLYWYVLSPSHIHPLKLDFVINEI
jgi:hypothetical protein